MTHYNTTSQTGDALQELQDKAASQQERVLAYMRAMRGTKVNAWHVQRHVMPDAPITSARRCLTNLAAEGHLKVVGQVKAGPYNHVCNQYTAI